jgi:hypothetical protein
LASLAWAYQEASSFPLALVPVLDLAMVRLRRGTQFQESYQLRASRRVVVDVVAYNAVEPSERYWDPSLAFLVGAAYWACILGRRSVGMLGSSYISIVVSTDVQVDALLIDSLDIAGLAQRA